MPRPDTAYGATRLEPLLSIRDVAGFLGISRESVYRLIRAGEITPIRVGGLPRFAPADVRAFVDRQREPAKS